MALNVVSHNRYEKSPLNRVKIEPSSPSMENGKKKKIKLKSFMKKKVFVYHSSVNTKSHTKTQKRIVKWYKLDQWKFSQKLTGYLPLRPHALDEKAAVNLFRNIKKHRVWGETLKTSMIWNLLCLYRYV